MSEELKAELMDSLSHKPYTATLLDMLDEQLDLLLTSVKDLERRIDPVLRQAADGVEEEAADGVEEEADDTERELSDWSFTQSALNISLKRKLNMIDRLRLTVLDLSKRSML